MDRHQDEARVFGNFPSLFMGLVDARRRARALRRQAPLRRRDRRRSWPTSSTDAEVPRVHRRGRRALDLPQVPLLQAARLPRRHVPRRPARAAERGLALRDAARRPRAGRVPAARPRRGALLVPLPLRAADRDPVLRRADRGAARRIPRSTTPHVTAHRAPQPLRGRRLLRGPARDALPPLQGEAGRADQLGQPDHRHGPEQPGDEPDGPADRQALREGTEARRKAC